MKFCPVVPEICRGQVHGPRKERRKRRKRIIIILIIKNGAKTISFVWETKLRFLKTLRRLLKSLIRLICL
jgi:hypothetical protein